MKNRFYIEELPAGFRATCKQCQESSEVFRTVMRATRWTSRHAATELDGDYISYAAELVAAGFDFDE